MRQFLLFELVGFLLGLIFGSFLNVCIARLPRGGSLVRPRSQCPHCGALIRWYDNIPILSWVLLRGHCRACKGRIPLQYPFVELFTGLWFLFAAQRLALLLTIGSLSAGQLASAITAQLSFVILGFLLLGLMVMDWQTHLLPDVFTWTGIALGFVIACVRAFFLGPNEDQIVLNTTHQLRLSSPGSFDARGNVFMTGPESMVNGWVLETIGAAVVLLFIRWLYKAVRHREGMGLGDVKLLALIAAFLGFWPAMLALFLGVFLASIYAVILLTRGQAGAATRLPLGSFLAIGGLIAAVHGDRILAIYRSFF